VTFDRSHRHTRSASGWVHPAQFDQPQCRPALPPVRLEQLEHSLIATFRFTGQNPRHQMRQVIITQRYGIRITECDARNLTRGPATNPPNRCEPALSLQGRKIGSCFKPPRVGATPSDGVGSLSFDPEWVKGVVGDAGKNIGGYGKEEI
jgi:hypothetical protein